PVFGVGEQEGVHYYAMQFIHGQGLDEVLQEVKRLRQARDPGQSCKEAVRNPLTGSIAQSLLSGCFTPHPPDRTPGRPGPAEAAHREGQAPAQAPDTGDAWSAAAPPQDPTPEQPAAADAGSSSVALPRPGGLSALSDSHHHYFRSVAQVGLQVAE